MAQDSITIYHIAYFLGAAAAAYGIIRAIASSFSRKGEIHRSDYTHITTLTALRQRSSEQPILLVTETADPGIFGANSARRQFENDVIPKVLSPAKTAGIRLCWCNLARTDIAKWLKQRKLKRRGCFLVHNGEILKHTLFGALTFGDDAARKINLMLAECQKAPSGNDQNATPKS
jgi:hypothetical protein